MSAVASPAPKTVVRALVFPAYYSQISTYVAEIRAALPPAYQVDLAIAAVSEALSNAIVHGALGIAGRKDDEDLVAFIEGLMEAEVARGATKPVSVVVEALPHGPAYVHISDPGKGFDWKATMAREGHGLSIVEGIANSVQWNDRGNVICLGFSPPISP